MIIITKALITGGGYFNPIEVHSGDNTYRINNEGRVIEGGIGHCTPETLRLILKLAKENPSVRVRFLEEKCHES